jgi:hypothetical protein
MIYQVFVVQYVRVVFFFVVVFSNILHFCEVDCPNLQLLLHIPTLFLPAKEYLVE